MNKLNFSSADPNINRFLRDLTRKCKKFEVNLNLSFTDSVQDEYGDKSAGFFDGKVIAVALKDPRWLETLVHESCHFDQMIENADVYLDCDKPRYSIWDWINGKELSEKYVKRIVRLSLECELDCEKRSVNKIKRFKLPIDTDEYTQKANAYVLFYNYIGLTRRWFDEGKEPTRNPEIIELMSNRFDMDYKKLDPELIDLFADCVTI